MRHGIFHPGKPVESIPIVEQLARHKPDPYHFFRNFGDRIFWPEEEQMFRERGIQPMVTWEPYEYALEDIAAGEHDAIIAHAAADIAAYGLPFLVRFGHEFNGGWYPWGQQPDALHDSFRHVAQRLRQNAPNARMVWCPNVIGGGSVDDDLGAYWPGSTYVQWVGIDGYNWGGSQWQSFQQVIRPTYVALQPLSGRPFMICETGSAEGGGSKATWINQIKPVCERQMPRISVVCWFNHDERSDGKGDWRIDSSLSSLAAYRQMVS